MEQQYCHGQAGPKNTINYENTELDLSLYTKKEEDRGLLIHLSAKPSQGTELHFLSQEFEVTIDGQAVKIRPEKVVGFNYRPFNAQRSDELGKWETLVGGNYDIYFIYLYLDIRGHADFEVPISFDGNQSKNIKYSSNRLFKENGVFY